MLTKEPFINAFKCILSPNLSKSKKKFNIGIIGHNYRKRIGKRCLWGIGSAHPSSPVFVTKPYWIKFYWNTARLFHILSMAAFMLQCRVEQLQQGPHSPPNEKGLISSHVYEECVHRWNRIWDILTWRELKTGKSKREMHHLFGTQMGYRPISSGLLGEIKETLRIPW